MKNLSVVLLSGVVLSASYFGIPHSAIAQGLPESETIINSIKKYRALKGTEIFRYNPNGVAGAFEIYRNDRPFVIEIQGENTNFNGAFFVDAINLGTGIRDQIWGGVNVTDGELGKGVTLEQVQFVRNDEVLGLDDMGNPVIDDFTGSNANYGVAGRDGIIFFTFLDEPRDVTVEQIIDPNDIPEEVVERWSASPAGAVILNATTFRAVNPDEVPLDANGEPKGFFNLEGLSGPVSRNPYTFEGFDAEGNPPTQYDKVVIPARCCAFPIFREGYTLEGIPLSAIGIGWSAQRFERRLDFGARNDFIRGNGGNEIINGGEGHDTVLGRGGDDVLIGEAGADRIRGGRGNDLLEGGIGPDHLKGERGNDILIGGDSNFPGIDSSDRFIFGNNRKFVSKEQGVDMIIDFQPGLDIIVLDLDTFTALTSDAGSAFSVITEFTIVTADKAAEFSSAIIVYNSANGKLFYNPNGGDSGFGSGGQFVLLVHGVGSSTAPELTRSDFFLRR